MNSSAGIKKKILYDFIEPGSLSGNLDENPLFSKRVDRLRRENVTGIFIVTPRVSDSYAFLRLVREFELLGFPVRSIYINELTPDLCHYIDRAVEDIVSQFRKGSCMIVSYGSTYAAAMIAGIFISAGKSVDEAVARVEAISATLRMSEEEKNFLSTYRRYVTGAGTSPVKRGQASEDSSAPTGRKKITAEKFFGPGEGADPRATAVQSREDVTYTAAASSAEKAPAADAQVESPGPAAAPGTRIQSPATSSAGTTFHNRPGAQSR